MNILADEHQTRLINCDELRELCELTVKLTELRQNECKHLCIENFAPELLGKLLSELINDKAGELIMKNEKRSVNIPHRFIDGSATITEVRHIADEDDPHILLIQEGDCIAIRPESWPEIRDAIEEMLPLLDGVQGSTA